MKYQDEFNRYDNHFIRLRPGQSHAGKLTIDGKQIPINPKLESEDWTLDVRFANVFNLPKADMDELLHCVGTRYSFPCLGKLEEVAQVLTVGTLIVEVKSRP